MPNQFRHRYYCSFGANIDARCHAEQVLTQLLERFSTVIVSSAIETAPVAIDTPNRFLNWLFILDTPLPPFELKQLFNQIETGEGRNRNAVNSKYRDRPADLDIISIDLLPVGLESYLTPLWQQLTQGLVIDSAATLNLGESQLSQRAATIHLDASSGHIRVVEHHPQSLPDGF